MISAFDQIIPLLEEIDGLLEKNVDIFALGGIALMHRGLRAVTKDIDLVVSGDTKYFMLRKILDRIGFTQKKPEFGYEHFNLSQIVIREDFRIDLFSKTVCKRLSLSSGMMKRAEKVIELGKLRFYLCSNEDIFLFKTMTQRPGDLDDCIALAARGISWDAILDELQSQIRYSGRAVWITWIGERLDILVEKGLNIPIMKQVDLLREEYFEELERKSGK